MQTSRDASPANTQDLLALLPLPDLGTVSDPQFKGTACVWGGEPVDTATAIDLGQRRIRCADGHITASPRACRSCTAKAVCRFQAFEHAFDCELCTEHWDKCEIGRALVRLRRELRR